MAGTVKHSDSGRLEERDKPPGVLERPYGLSTESEGPSSKLRSFWAGPSARIRSSGLLEGVALFAELRRLEGRRSWGQMPQGAALAHVKNAAAESPLYFEPST